MLNSRTHDFYFFAHFVLFEWNKFLFIFLLEMWECFYFARNPNFCFPTSLTEMSRNSDTNRDYNRASCCWNCRGPGHRSSDCPQPKRLFCSYCLKDGTTTRNCGCRPSRIVTKKLTPHTPEDWKKYPECSKASRASEAPLWIGVGNESFRTFIHTSQVQTRVGWLVATKASLCYGTRREFIHHEDGIISESLIPFRYQNTVRTIRCRINEEPSDQIFFGWFFLFLR